MTLQIQNTQQKNKAHKETGKHGPIKGIKGISKRIKLKDTHFPIPKLTTKQQLRLHGPGIRTDTNKWNRI